MYATALSVHDSLTIRIAGGVCGWAGGAGPVDALALLRRRRAATGRIESFEIIRGDSLARGLDHVPGTRSPLARPHAWHVLIEAVASDPDAESPAALIERLLAPALADGLIGDAVVATNETQAEAFWRLRDSLSEAERADGPALQFGISVPVERTEEHQSALQSL